jgi:hypothetical protein
VLVTLRTLGALWVLDFHVRKLFTLDRLIVGLVDELGDFLIGLDGLRLVPER